MIAALVLIWRTTRSVASLVFVGLHPAVVTAIVNGGHNDSLVGLAILAGALLAARRRWLGAGFVLGLGLLVKASAGLGLLGIAVWTFRRDRMGAARLVVIAAITTLVGYLPAGTAAVRAIGDAGNGGNSRASVWDPISSALHPPTTIVVALVLLLTAGAAYVWRSSHRPSTPALATTAAFLIAGVYVLPWYPAWALPTAALERRSRLSWLVALQAAFLVAVYEYELPAHPTLTGVVAVMRTALLQIGAWAALLVFVLLLLRARSRRE